MFKAIDKFPVFRSFPTQSKLTVEAAQVLRKVLYNGNITRNLEDMDSAFVMRWDGCTPKQRMFLLIISSASSLQNFTRSNILLIRCICVLSDIFLDSLSTT